MRLLLLLLVAHIKVVSKPRSGTIGRRIVRPARTGPLLVWVHRA